MIRRSRIYKSIAYNNLFFGKPSSDIYIDDKDLNFKKNWIKILQKKTYKLFVGADNVSALVGIILKKLGRVEKVAYWTLDYRPVRFENRVMNTVFHWLDRFCVYYYRLYT